MPTAAQQAKSLVLGVVLMVIAGLAPAIVMGALGWHDAVSVAILSGLAAFIACNGGKGWHTGLIIAGPFSVLAALAVWAAPYALLASLVLALAAFLRGYGAKIGVQNALLMTVIALGFMVASPPHSNTSLPTPIFVGLIALGTTLWVTLVVFVLRKQLQPQKLVALDPVKVLAFSIILALMVGVATWCVVHFDLGHAGGWIILTIVVVFQPSFGAGFKKSAGRVAGTLVGFAIAIVAGALLPAGAAMYIGGAVFLILSMLAMLEGRAYWIFATFITAGIVLLESAGQTVEKVAFERLGATLIGVAGTMVVMLALSPLAKRLNLTD